MAWKGSHQGKEHSREGKLGDARGGGGCCVLGTMQRPESKAGKAGAEAEEVTGPSSAGHCEHAGF